MCGQPQSLVERQLDALMRRIATTSPMLLTPVDELAERLHAQYPHDVGVFCAYLLNYLVLEPGEVTANAQHTPLTLTPLTPIPPPTTLTLPSTLTAALPSTLAHTVPPTLTRTLPPTLIPT